MNFLTVTVLDNDLDEGLLEVFDGALVDGFVVVDEGLFLLGFIGDKGGFRGEGVVDLGDAVDLVTAVACYD